jgi:THO complex subunit 4
MVYAGYRAIQPQPPMVFAIDEPTKLYISNLDYGVSNDDIKESLFFSCHKPCWYI